MKKLTCHCKEVEIEVNLDEPIKKIVRCNCSICKRKGAIMTLVNENDFKITKGKNILQLYQYHTKIAKHYFCSKCGIYTHHNPRSNPKLYGINIGCIDLINTFELKEIAILDGENHPLDKK